VNITVDVKSLPLFTDTGTGEVNQATIVVRALDGAYITSTSPKKIEEFDRIRIECTDLAAFTYDRYFEVINIIPTQSKGEGTLLTLECLGIEHHTQHIHYAKPFYFEDSYTASVDIGDVYNSNNGSEQPTLSNHNVVFTSGNGFGSALPFYNANNIEFGLNEDTCYNRWMDLIEGSGAAVSAGGALTFFELNFLTTGVNAMNFKLRASGDNSTILTIKNAKVTDPKTVGTQEGELSNPTGTNLLAWGSSEHGTLPVDNSKYDSELLKFIFRPEWITGTVYAVDARVKVTGTGTPAPKHYRVPSGQAHTSGTFATDLTAGKWTQIDMADEFGDDVQYSPWTDDKATVWSNNGCDPDRTVFTNAGWFDINVVVNEEDFFRTWADVKATTDAELDDFIDSADDGTNKGYAYDGGTRANLPRGFRILVNGDSPTGDLANFANMVVDVVPTNSVGGKKLAKLYNFDTANTKVQVAVIDEGKVYTDTITAGPSHSWSDISEADYGNDCFHPYTTAPVNVDGVDLVHDPAAAAYKTRSEVTDNTERPDITQGGTEFTKNQESAIEFKAVAADAITSAASNASDELADYYINAIGFNFRIPYPYNNYNSISEGVGDLYGGGINSNEEPATLDIQNMNYTAGGKQGFNQGAESEDYGQINAVAFWLKYSVVEAAGSTELNDEHQFRAWFIDTKDNCVYQDFVIRFSNHWEDIRLPISGFRIYKGRKPVYGFDVPIAAFIPPKELEVINIFEWRNVKLFGVQLQSQYDEFGRFNPGAAAIDEAGNSVTWSNILGSTRTLIMDGFRFIKPLLVTSGQNTTRNLEPDFKQYPNITAYHQLLNAAKSQLEIEKFKHKEFVIDTSGEDMFDILFGESFYLLNTDLVSDSDNATTGNIKLVAKRIEYSITKTPSGVGGLKRRIMGSKIFT